jgi:hypothetical protein
VIVFRVAVILTLLLAGCAEPAQPAPMATVAAPRISLAQVLDSVRLASADPPPTGLPPAGSVPAGSVPAGPLPAGSVPAGSLAAGPPPAGPLPAGSAPAGPLPAGSAPAGPLPAGSAPAGPLPAGSAPAGPLPAGSAPAGSAPAGSAPAGSAPAGSAPAGSLPAGLTPSVVDARGDIGFDSGRCEAAPGADRIEPCVFGDPAAGHEVVLYGDSSAGMWLPAMIEIARRRHWRLEFYGKPACPAPNLTFWNQGARRPFAECDRFRRYVTARVLDEHPALVVVTSRSFAQKTSPGVPVSPARWQAGLTSTLVALRRSGAQVVFLGEAPVPDQSAPDCLAAHRQDCATSRATATSLTRDAADAAAARAAGAGHVDVVPWFCAVVCPVVISGVIVYRNRFALTATYARVVSGVLEDALPVGSAS